MAAQLIAWCQQWEESERGWGSRPDGYSLHLTPEDAKAYIVAYWEQEKKRNTSGETPDEYDRPAGNVFCVIVDKKILKELNDEKAKKNHGVRYYDHNQPKAINQSDQAWQAVPSTPKVSNPKPKKADPAVLAIPFTDKATLEEFKALAKKRKVDEGKLILELVEKFLQENPR